VTTVRGRGLQDELQPLGDVLVQDALPPVPVHKLRDGDGQYEVWPPLVQSPEVVTSASIVTEGQASATIPVTTAATMPRADQGRAE